MASYQELVGLHKRLKPLLDNRVNLGPREGAKRLILVCGGTGCQASESQQIVAEFQKRIATEGLGSAVRASISGCFGFCEKGPIVKIFPDDVFYVQVKPDDVPEIIEEHIMNGQRVKRLLYEEPVLKQKVETQHAMSFYRKQQRIALRNCGLINPEDIEEYLATGGYGALGKALTEMTPEAVIDVMKRSGLRGRGGAGFPTGRKWEFARGYPSDEKFIICNADEGDPGAFMDRSIMEGDSHSVIEGMAIAGYAIGAHQGYVYIRAEYPLAVKRLQIALDQARNLGLIGKNILGSGFDFDVDIKLGAGAFVCGEETALIHSIEGLRGEPHTKPPFPAQAGLWDKPTIVNNVETLANVPAIMTRGADWYSAIGTADLQRHQGVRAGRPDQQRRPGRGADGHDPARDHLQHRRRHPGRPGVQGRADGRPLGRLHPQAVPRYPDRLRIAGEDRLDHGLRRHDRHEREGLHGEHRQVLPGVHRG